MSRKEVAVIMSVVFCLMGICCMAYAADAKKPTVVRPAISKSPAMRPMPSNTSMFGGTIEKIDTTDPTNIKIQVKDDATGASRTISVAPWTNVTKVTDATELKTGDPVRVMVRKTGDKDIAMGILFGKIRNIPPMRPRPVPPAVKK